MAKAVYSASLSGVKKTGTGLEFKAEFTIDEKAFSSDGQKNNEIALSAVKSQNPGIMTTNNLSKLVCRGYSKVRSVDNSDGNSSKKSKSGKSFLSKLLSGDTFLDKVSNMIFK